MKIDEKLAENIEETIKDARLYEFHAEIDKYLPALIGIVERYKTKVGKPRELDYSLEDMQDMAIAFFEDFSPSLAERVKRVLESAQISSSEPCRENEKKGNCVRRGNWGVEIVLNPVNDVTGVCTVAHEYAHACSQRVVEYMGEEEQLIGEIESKFIEKVYADWLLANEAISQDDYDFKLHAQRQDLVADCEIILEEDFLLKMLNHDFSEQHLEEVVSIYPKRMEECVERMSDGKISPYIGRYVVAEFVVQVLYQEYCQNPELVGERFTEYMACNAELSFDEAIKFLLGENYIEKINCEFFPKKQQNQQES